MKSLKIDFQQPLHILSIAIALGIPDLALAFFAYQLRLGILPARAPACPPMRPRPPSIMSSPSDAAVRALAPRRPAHAALQSSKRFLGTGISWDLGPFEGLVARAAG